MLEPVLRSAGSLPQRILSEVGSQTDHDVRVVVGGEILAELAKVLDSARGFDRRAEFDGLAHSIACSIYVAAAKLTSGEHHGHEEVALW